MLLFFVALSMLFLCPDVYTRRDSRRMSGKGFWGTANLEILYIDKGQLKFQVLRTDSLYYFINGPHAAAEFVTENILSHINYNFIMWAGTRALMFFWPNSLRLRVENTSRPHLQMHNLDPLEDTSLNIFSKRVNKPPNPVISVLINNQFNYEVSTLSLVLLFPDLLF